MDEVRANGRGVQRYFIVDPATAIGTNRTLPYTQTNIPAAGLPTTQPTNRFIILSSLCSSQATVAADCATAAAHFQSAWESDEGIALTSATTGWPTADWGDVLIQRVDYRYDTNMTALTTLTAEPPQGYWFSYAGTWLVDQSSRESHSIRYALIATGVQGEIPLPTDLEDGYTDHRVLSADSESVFVLSTINWPTTTLHYFTLFNASGIIFQRRMSCMETITGVTSLTNGWLLSAQSIGQANPKNYLFRVDPTGAVHAQLRIDPAAPQNYLAMNTVPPRVLHIMDEANMEIIDVEAMSGFGWWMGRSFLNPAVETLRGSPATAPVGSTNYFWITPICPSNK